MDYCPNGDFKSIKSINNIKLCLAEIILAIDCIHKHNIIYRDLKPENILLDTSGHINICDFNLSKMDVPKDQRADSFCGSPMYLSPEMLCGRGVDYRCDIYGLGLLMYELIVGIPAYNANDIQSLYDLIRRNYIDLKSPNMSEEARDLLGKILKKNPEFRISLEEIKKHPYFKTLDFNKVLRKEYGPIITEKNILNKADEDLINKNLNTEELEKIELMKFRLQQKQLDENEEYSFLEGKITVREMYRDQKRIMKNIVREFYFIKKKDLDEIKELQKKEKSHSDIANLIKEKEK
jgi:serine/threonine protein kinase